MKIRAVNETDGLILRDLHLRMYADSPTAFGETLQAVRTMSAEQWDVRAGEYSNPEKAQAWIAWERDRAIGFVIGLLGWYRDEEMHWDVTKVATLARAWIDPAVRRRGIGRLLAETVRNWAIDSEVETLETQVTENNVPAIQFYRALGFIDTGHREPLKSDRSLAMHFLVQSLR